MRSAGLEQPRLPLIHRAAQKSTWTMCLCVGIEALVVLRDVYGLEAKEVEEVAGWAAFALLRANLSESSDGGCSGMINMRPNPAARSCSTHLINT